MPHYSHPIAATLLVALSACGLSQEAATNSGFRTPSASGVMSGGVDNDSQRSATFLFSSTGGGVSMESGTVGDDGFAAYAGIIPGTTVGSGGLTGTATYRGTYRALDITDINLSKTSSSSGFLTGQPGLTTGAITLTANFNGSTLTGTSDDTVLSVAGQVGTGTSLSGTVRYLGVNGQLRGLVGSTGAVGAFHGNNADTIFAGGFVTTPE